MHKKKNFKRLYAIFAVILLTIQLFGGYNYTAVYASDEAVETYDSSTQAEWQSAIMNALDTAAAARNGMVTLDFRNMNISVSDTQADTVKDYINNLAVNNRKYSWIEAYKTYCNGYKDNIYWVYVYVREEYIDSSNNILKDKAASDYDIIQQRIKNGETKTIIYERIESGFKKFRNTSHSKYRTNIELYLADLHISSGEHIEEDISAMLNQNPEYAVLLLDSGSSPVCSLVNGYVTRYSISLKSDCLTDDGMIDYNAVYDKYFAYRKRTASLTGQLNDMSELEKVLAIHEWVVRECDYDYANYLNGAIPNESYYPDGVLNKGLAVCNGYMLTMTKLLTENGVACYNVSSKSMNHGWNIVKVDGKYYHVDSTWDDWGKNDTYLGRGYTRYFLRSDNEFTSYLEHKDWVLREGGSNLPVCDNSGSYPGYIFRNATLSSGSVYIDEIRSFSYYNNYWYYIKYNGYKSIQDENNDYKFVRKYSLMRSKIDGTEETEVFNNDELNYDGMVNQFIYGNYMYLATEHNIYKINMKNMSDRQVMFSLKSDNSEGTFDRIAIKNDTLIVMTTNDVKQQLDIAEHGTINLSSDSYNMNEDDTQKLDYSYNSEYGNKVLFLSDNPDVVKVDQNGNITAVSHGTAIVYAQVDDVVKTCTVNVAAKFKYGDANGDGKIDSKDAVVLKKYLAGYKDLNINTEACDVNLDGEVTSVDAVRLLKYLAGYNVELGAA